MNVDEPLTPEMMEILRWMMRHGPAQFQAILNGVLEQAGMRAVTPLERQVLFAALQELMGYGYLVPGADLQRPTWPWLTLTERGRQVAEAHRLL